MQEFPALCNRYQALQSTEDIDNLYLSNQHDSSLETQLEGNKNKTENKLDGKPCYYYAYTVTYSTCFKGNKNKTGEKLGMVREDVAPKCITDQNKHCIHAFRGNKMNLEQNWVTCLLKMLIHIQN